MMTADDRQQADKFHGMLYNLIEQFLLEGADVDVMKTILRNEADHLGIRKELLEHGL